LVELLQAISAKGVELELECKTWNFQAQDYCSSKLFVFLLESMVAKYFWKHPCISDDVLLGCSWMAWNSSTKKLVATTNC
jgi:hypothetical protein